MKTSDWLIANLALVRRREEMDEHKRLESLGLRPDQAAAVGRGFTLEPVDTPFLSGFDPASWPHKNP